MIRKAVDYLSCRKRKRSDVDNEETDIVSHKIPKQFEHEPFISTNINSVSMKLYSCEGDLRKFIPFQPPVDFQTKIKKEGEKRDNHIIKFAKSSPNNINDNHLKTSPFSFDERIIDIHNIEN